MALEQPPSDLPFQPRVAPLSEAQGDVLAALVTGQLAGFVMLAATMIAHPLFLDAPAIQPLQVIATIASGAPGLRDDPAAPLLGFVVHQFVLTVAWSLVFAALLRISRLRTGAGVVAVGLIVGFVSHAVDVDWLLAPLRQADWSGELLGVGSWFWHLLFGLGLGLFPWVRGRVIPASSTST